MARAGRVAPADARGDRRPGTARALVRGRTGRGLPLARVRRRPPDPALTFAGGRSLSRAPDARRGTGPGGRSGSFADRPRPPAPRVQPRGDGAAAVEETGAGRRPADRVRPAPRPGRRPSAPFLRAPG